VAHGASEGGGLTEPWLTKREVARELRVSVRTIERLRLPCMKVGGQNRYLMSQVVRAMSGAEELPENVVRLRPRRRERVA
jgi:hypothetical protein